MASSFDEPRGRAGRSVTWAVNDNTLVTSAVASAGLSRRVTGGCYSDREPAGKNDARRVRLYAAQKYIRLSASPTRWTRRGQAQWQWRAVNVCEQRRPNTIYFSTHPPPTVINTPRLPYLPRVF